MGFIDKFINSITMYRLMLYFLSVLFVYGLALSLFGVLPFGAVSLLVQTLILLAVSWIANTIFSKIFKVITNLESVYITAYILTLIITPRDSINHYLFLGLAGALAMASKYILAINRQHLFNPVAIAVVLTGLFIGQSANWWAAGLEMLPPVLVGGLLITRKIRKFQMIATFLVAATISITTFELINGAALLPTVQLALLHSLLFFFGFVMFSEPLTTPPTNRLQLAYALLVGLLYSPQIHIGTFYFTPEFSLVLGNLFSFAVSPKFKSVLTLKERIELSPDIYDFVFTSNQPIKFNAGQYLEWTLEVPKPDSRGNRRFFTIASSPTEPEIRLGIKIYPKPSTFKQQLLALKPGDRVIAGQLAGDFNLPVDPQKKLVFIAGGIGVTPFRSMVKSIVDQKQPRDVSLLYSAASPGDVVYTDIFAAAKPFGLKTYITLTDPTKVPANWNGQTGLIDQTVIAREVPNYKERTFYLSGPRGMVVAFEKTLAGMGVTKTQIITDYFPGFA